MIERETLNAAIAEARRFIAAAEALKKARLNDIDNRFPGNHPRESGAVRRASMDLTRKLADLRAGR